MGVGNAWGRDLSSAAVDELIEALERWEYRSKPTPTAALATDLRASLADPRVVQTTCTTDADIVVDDIAILLVEDLGPRFRTRLQVVADHYDDVVCYSPEYHRTQPREWRTTVHQLGSHSVRFVTPASSTDGRDGSGSVNLAAVGIPLMVIATVAVLAASVGVFSVEGAVERDPYTAVTAGIVLACLLVGAVVYGHTKSRINALLVRLAQ